MNPEPLIGKLLVGRSREELRGKLLFDYRDIKSACEFYFRYKNKPDTFITENSEYREEVIGKYWMSIDKETYEPCWDLERYNDWLFQLAFKDVLGDKR